MKFKKKPVVVEAMQWTGLNLDEIKNFTGKDAIAFTPYTVTISTLEGCMTGRINDWIIKGLNGEFYPCKPDIFEKTYDKVDENAI